MDVYKDIQALGAEIAYNKATVRNGAEYTVVAEVVDGSFDLTAEGRELYAAHQQALGAAPQAAKAARATRKGAVGSGDSSPADDEQYEMPL